MAFTRSPMENYNKNNPLTILTKQVYDTIMDELQQFSKSIILRLLIMGAISLLFIAYILFIWIDQRQSPKAQLTTLFIYVVAIVYFYSWGMDRCAYFLKRHPAMLEFDRMSKLEMSAVAELGVEDLLKCLHGEYELLGGLRSTVGIIKRFGEIIIVAQGVSLLAHVISTIVNYA